MPSAYRVIQYGNLLTGEVLNIGVVAFGDGRVRSQFLTDWSRVWAAFGSEGDPILTGWVRYFVNEVRTEAQLDEVVGRCRGPYSSLQITEQRASLDDPDALLQEVSARFLDNGGVRG